MLFGAWALQFEQCQQSTSASAGLSPTGLPPHPGQAVGPGFRDKVWGAGLSKTGDALPGPRLLLPGSILKPWYRHESPQIQTTNMKVEQIPFSSSNTPWGCPQLCLQKPKSSSNGIRGG